MRAIGFGQDQPSSYVVVDTETTGIDARSDRVIEIAAVRVEGGRIVDHFDTLIDPGVRIPRRITRLTGITNADLTGAPAPADALRRYLEFAGQDVRVAHNAGFDRRFIAAELARLGLEGESAPYLCTVLLSRRLLPGLPSKRLDSVAHFLGLEIGNRHRALADAELTAHVLMGLSERAQRLGRGGADALLSLQRSRYVASGASSAHVERILREVIPELPDTPGVYRMFDARGRLLYVGKAVALRRRVGSYFVGVEAKPARIRDLVTKARRIEVEETATELEALLLEAGLIRDLQPPFNRALRRAARRAWLRIGRDGVNRPSTVSVRSTPAGDGAAWYGPLASPGEAAVLAEIIGALFDLAVERRPARTPYEQERLARVKRTSELARAAASDSPFSLDGPARPDDNRGDFGDPGGHVPPAHAEPAVTGSVSVGAFLDGAADAVVSVLETAMRRASADFRFEEAAVLRDWIELLRRLGDEPGPLVDTMHGTDHVRMLVEASGITVAVAPAARGVTVIRTEDPADVGYRIREVLISGASDWDDSALRIVAQWAYRNREEVVWMERGPAETVEVFSQRVAAAVVPG